MSAAVVLGAAVGGVAALAGAGPVGAGSAAVAVAAVALHERLRRGAPFSALIVPQASGASHQDREKVARTLSLELAYDRSRSVLDALQEGVLVVDPAGEIVIANPAARRAMVEPGDDPTGRLFLDALKPELVEHLRCAWDELIRRDRLDGESPQIRQQGIACGDRVYDLAAVEARSARTGQDFGTVFLLVDATRAYDLQRTKDRFLSNVSHELRTPLTSVCAYAEILHRMPPGHLQEWAEFARMIYDESTHLSGLVDGLFDYLQLESGEAHFDDECFDGVDVVRDAVARVEPKAAARSVVVQVRADGDPPVLRGDARRFGRVVEALLDNAIKFGRDGGRVSVCVTGREEGFELRVQDDGPGVPVEQRQDVFETFHQLRDHLTDKPDGTGIGLATSRAVVTRMGGLIWCEGVEGGGACFVVLLPGAEQSRLVHGDTEAVPLGEPAAVDA